MVRMARQIVRYGVGLGVGLCLLVGCSETVDPNAMPAGPEQIAETFYRALLANPLVDLPTPEQLRPFRPLLQQSLLRRLEQAHAVDLSIRSSTQLPTPPAVQGSLFTSLADGFTDFELVACQTKKLKSRCQFTLIYNKQGHTIEWQDELRLRRGRLGWQVEDLVYGGNWAYAPTGKLTSRLDVVIASAPAPTKP